MKKRFIILIDFSEYSSNLIKFACNWNKYVNAELLLVHQNTVLTPVFTDIDNKKSITEESNNQALQKLKVLAKRLIPLTVKVSYFVSECHLELTLLKLLDQPYENLIFVGLKGTGLLKKIFIGSVALEVIDNTKNIVAAIPKGIATFSPEKIFVAVSEKHPLNLLELTGLLDLIDKKKTSIIFFYLSKPNEKTRGTEKLLSDLCELFADRFNTSFTIYEGSSSFDDIKKVINNKVDEILIVQKGSRHLTDRLFRKFLINDLVYEGQTPLIILP